MTWLQLLHVFKGMMRRDGFQEMGIQKHLLDCGKKEVLHIGRGL